MVQAEEPRKLRKLYYMLETKGLRERDIKRIFYDWAVTLRIHPWALGIYSQDQGLLTVPEALKIVCTLVQNVFQGSQIERYTRSKGH